MYHFYRSRSAWTGCALICLPILLQAQTVSLAPGTQLALSGSIHFTLNDGGINNGGIFSDNSGTVHMLGASTSPIGGSGVYHFNNLDIHKTAGNVLLNTGIQVNGNLNFTSGNLDLNAQQLDLGTSGILLNESASSGITGTSGGTVLRTAVLNAPVAVNPGNIGVEITATGNLDTTTLSRSYETVMVSPVDTSMRRVYTLNPTNNSQLNASVKVYYNDNELQGMNEADLYLWTSADMGATWAFRGRTSNNLTSNFVQKDSLGSLGKITLSTNHNNAPLPLNLVSFNAQLKDDKVLLDWTTVNEKDLDYFEVQRATDGKTFQAIGIVDGKAGGGPQQYHLADLQPAADNLYRLKIVDNSREFNYSPVVAVHMNYPIEELAGIYPNPAVSRILLRLISGKEQFLQLSVFDLSGKQVGRKDMKLEKGNNLLEYDLSSLAAGSYFLHFDPLNIAPVKVIKQNQ